MAEKPPINADHKPIRRLNVRALPVAVGIFALLYGLTGYRGWLVFLIGTAGVWLLAILWILSLEHGLHIERKIHLAWAGIGDSVPEELKLTNTGWMPAVWVELFDSSNSLVKPLRMISDIEGRFSRTRHINHIFNRRGLYTLGPTRLRTGDPFGIYTLTIYNQHVDTILVTPPVLALPQFHIIPGGWAGDQNRRQTGLEREISDAGTRMYQPGDSLKRIHWTASAHQDTLIVRQLEAASSQDYWIFVDLDRAVQAGEGQNSTLELAIVLAASVTMRGLQERRRVGLVLAGPNLIRLSPRSDPAHRWQIFQALATAETGNRPLADLLSIRRPSQAASLILITPAIDPAWVASIGKKRDRMNVQVLLIDPAEFGGFALQDQSISSLTINRIPYLRMPKSLLDQAYTSSENVKPPWQASVEWGKRYLRQKEATWQSMD